MSTAPADRARAAFLAYRRTRAPQHLAEVFDLCAQELLLVAHHVARRGVSPEDLLQTTFLEAITHAEHYDSRRPLAPWLCGILLNVARREDRTQLRELAGWRLEPPPEVDPSELAHAREFADALREAIAELPAPQREVLTLRLVHGLTPTQIAHALGHPVGSVKSWIHRGVEHLRMALPAALVAVLATVVAAETTLEAVRERVLESASVPTGGAPTGAEPVTPAGVHGPGGKVFLAPLVIGAVGLLGALVWFVSDRTDGRSTAEHALADPSSRSAENARSPSRPGDTAAEPARTAPGPRDDIPEPGLTLRVRGARGGPAAIGLRVEERLGADPELRARHVRADAGGRARLPGLPPGEYVIHPDRGAARFVDVPARGIVVDVELEGERVIAGRALDRAHAPIEGAQVWLSRASSLNEGEVVARTASDGTFELSWIPPGRAVTVWADGFLPSALAATATWPDRPVDVVLESTSRRVDGVVLDEAGEPIRGARVQVGRAIEARWTADHLQLHELVPPLTVDTDVDGRFSFASVRAAEPVELLARAAGRRLHAQSVEDEHALVIRLDPGASWIGVIDLGAGVGAGVGAGAGVAEVLELRAGPPASDDGAEPNRPAWSAPHARVRSGAFELGGLPEGPVVLTVAPRDRAARRHELRAPATGRVEWSPALRDPAPGTGVVRTSSGTRLSGARVEVFATKGPPRTVVASTLGEFALEELALGELAPGERAPGPATFAVRGPASVYEGLLEPWLEADPGNGPLELVVRDEHEPRTLLILTALDTLGRPVEDLVLHRALDPTPIEGRRTPDGRFEFGPLPQGDFHALCSGELGPRIAHGPIAVRGEARVDAGVLREAEPGRLTVRFADLELADRAEVSASISGEDGAIGLTYFKLKDGTGTTLPSSPGKGLLVVAFPASGMVLHDVELLAGRRVEVVLPEPTGRPVTLALVDADPRATIRARITWRRADGGAVTSLCHTFRRNRPDGTRSTVWNLEPGRQRVEVQAWGTPARTVEFDVPATEAVPVVRVELRP